MAGLSAALELARAGHEVALLERDSILKRTGSEAALQKLSRRDSPFLSATRLLASCPVCF